MINNKISLFIFYSLMSILALIAVWKCFANYICNKVKLRSSPCEDGSCFGFVNRHKHPLPKEKCFMDIMIVISGGYKILLCEWEPFDKSNYTKTNMPADGYLGSAKIAELECYGHKFHAWKQNDSEFVWYNIRN
jgi:hypothetical protein